MFESVATPDLLAEFESVVHDADDDFGASRVEVIAAAERVIRMAQAVQLEQIAALHRDRQVLLAGFRGDAALSVIGELALARHVSPGAAATQFGTAVGVESLPSVARALRDGVVSEPTVRAICREADPLHSEDRVVFDSEIAPLLPGLTPRRAAALARQIVIGIDAEAAAERAERARGESQVQLYSLADGIATLAVTGPAEQMVAAHGVLERWALGLRSAGDERSIGQIMCTTVVERITGVAHADGADVELGIVIDAATLLGTASNPAELVGYGPIAPAVADELIAKARRTWYRRLITEPVDGTLVARDPKRRFYDGPLAGHIRARDRHRCRQPGCECRIRDIDHVRGYADGGLTTIANAQSLCRRSHVIKHLPGWQVTTAIDGTITWRTPTGHTYVSRTPTYGLAA